MSAWLLERVGALPRSASAPAVSLAAIGLAALGALAAGRAGAVVALLGGVALGVAILRRRHLAADADDSGFVPVERLAACQVGPGATLHAVRFLDRTLLVAVSSAGVSVLDSSDAETQRDVRSEAQQRRRRGPRVVLPLALLLALAGAHGTSVARAAEQAAAEQRVDFQRAPAAGAASESTAIDHVPPPSTFEPPPDANRPINTGPMLWLAGLALLPFVFMGVTSFVKVTVVLSLLRNAIGTPQIPSDPVLAGIALALTAFVMAPVANEALGRIASSGANVETAAGALAAAGAAAEPVRGFLERNTRPDEIALFVDLSTRNGREALPPDALAVLVPAFVTSELRQAFIIGFLLVVPFLVVDLVVSNILMSMGMVMVSPATVAMPFKVMLFVLVDGWPLLMKGLALTYH